MDGGHEIIVYRITMPLFLNVSDDLKLEIVNNALIVNKIVNEYHYFHIYVKLPNIMESNLT